MILGIESTAHTFGIGIVSNGKILCNVKDSYTTEKGGIIPIDAAKHHKDIAEEVYNESLKEAKIKENQIDAIAISQSPGLPPCLIEGMKFAKKKALELNVPIIPVNHCISHLEIGRITGAKDPVLLYVSGANTQIIAYADGKYRIFGETLDIGVGNFIDNFARIIGIGFPGGPKVMKLAEKGKYIELPYTIKGMDVAFSGMLTKLKQMYEKGYKKEDLSFSLQETAFAMLVESAERALAQEMCEIMCKERDCKFYCPPNEFLLDNGGMIAFTGEILFNNKQYVNVRDFDKVDIDPRQRTDMVEIKYKYI
jgi:N6-L-threonylcarbamoyladenine synthase